MLVDAGWGMTWWRDAFITGGNALDTAGIGLIVRPGGARYALYETLFSGGPDQIIDSSWTPMFYAAAGINQCCGVPGSCRNDYTWRGLDAEPPGAFTELANGRPGILHSKSTMRTWAYGYRTPVCCAEFKWPLLTGTIRHHARLSRINANRQRLHGMVLAISGCTSGGGPRSFLPSRAA